ncbi:arginine--tRNA ligase [Aciditerrimonas ferrireducens]|uniref:arginine--tRNA ligase n=1 Tax=Aciditerrimonas ferrireducens TaxID=667306 RepID=UPI0020052F38|nr:arginine--tRNA ligase [Aciditerrimonas ferrireducens]MCK4177690.1 arginine--tRNA ligase [Aciditerrimonas ferrireducens]
MPDLLQTLADRLAAAFAQVAPGADPVLRRSDRADFQANGALALAKRLGRPPQEVAEAVVRGADLGDLCERVEVSGPGFVNLTLAADALAEALSTMGADDRLGVARSEPAERVVVDYSAPNVAKEMHVGHLRSTIIGDALVRVLGFLGHEVIRENHVGDWGTPFGMLIEHLLDLGEAAALKELSVGDLDAFYREARASFDADPAFRERSRRRVVLLQAKDPETLRLWQLLVAESVRAFQEVYDTLGVLLRPEDVVGESAYNDQLPEIVAELEAKGLLVEDQGARCVFPPGFTNREGQPLPLIVQKSDGGFGYAATDLAAIRDRVQRLGARRLLYVVGAPQAQHLQMCFAVARLAGWLPEAVDAEHVAFGSVLGTDGKMFRTRAGGTVKLADLLQEAVARAEAALAERGQEDEDPAERRAVARQLGIGAVKYADLATERTRDYVFDWNRMLAFEGNTGPYVQYAHARIRSIFRRAATEPPPRGTRPLLEAPEERALALALVAFPQTVAEVARSAFPHRLCQFLSELASTFTAFYETCPVLRAETEERRQSRLALCDLTARVLAQGLDLLGIAAPERM